MNATYAKLLAFTFFVGIGTFNVTKGIANIRARTENTLLGWARLLLGVIMILIPIPLFLFLRSTSSE